MCQQCYENKNQNIINPFILICLKHKMNLEIISDDYDGT